MTSEEFKKLEATLWQSADTLRANSDLKASEYSTPVLGLIFLKFADNKYSMYKKKSYDNYLWINLFATSLKKSGRAALVMANSASDARHSEADIRKTLIEKNLIYGMLTLPSNMFYTVTLPATLWFFDKAKKDNRILFIDARIKKCINHIGELY